MQFAGLRVRPGRAWLFVAAALGGAFPAIPVQAGGGDLLVAPTRIVLDGARGTEVILNNVGATPATYRISLELRRMTSVGALDEVSEAEASPRERQVLTLIRYAPRRVVLPPNQPQAVRLGAMIPADLPDGEYRAHLLFRAIPEARPVEAAAAPAAGVAIQITPIYGVTIPVIVRKGNLTATAGIANVHFGQDQHGPTLGLELSRSGTRSVYGDVRVTKPGVVEPLLVAKGIAVYPEVDRREVELPIAAELRSRLSGPVKVGYYATAEDGGALLAETTAVLP